MDTVIDIINDLCCIPGFPFRLGIVLSVAIILGLLLYEDFTSSWKWLLILFIYVLFQDWLSLLALESINHDMVKPIVLSILGLVLFGSGLLIGAFVARQFDVRSTVLSDSELKTVVAESIDAVKGASG